MQNKVKKNGEINFILREDYNILKMSILPLLIHKFKLSSTIYEIFGV